MRTFPYVLFSSTGMAQNYASSGLKIDYTLGYSVQAVYGGPNPRGTISLNASNDNVNWAQIANSSFLITGTSGSYMWNIWTANYDYMQFQFASSAASSGTMLVNLDSTGF